MAKPWTLELNNLSLGGFAPAYYKETYPSYGNRNMAGAMANMDLTNPGYITQGPVGTALTNGTQATATTTLIKGILEKPTSADVTFAIGGNLLHKLSSTSVVDDATWPHTIDKAAVTGEDGEDVIAFEGALYYLYNHSGSAGDIGKYDLSATFDDDWGSTVPTGMAALTNNPHPTALGGNGTFAFGNGRYLGTYDGTTLDTQALDLPVGSIVVDVQWKSDKWWVTANITNLSGANQNYASVFVWDGASETWETEVRLQGTAGASHTKNGSLFQFYRDLQSTGGYKLAFVDTGGVTDLASYDGELPAFYQVTDFKDFIMWLSDDDVFAYGSGDKDLPLRLFQYASTTHGEGGGLANPFGSLLAASWDSSTNYNIVSFGTYTTAASWKSLLFDFTGKDDAKLDCVRFNFETLASNARVNWSLVDNKGVTLYSDIVSHTKLGAVTTADYKFNGKIIENFRVQLDYANGSSTNPVSIRSIKLYGTN